MFHTEESLLSFKEVMACNYSLRYAFVNFLVAEGSTGEPKGPGETLVTVFTTSRQSLSQLDYLFLDEETVSLSAASGTTRDDGDSYGHGKAVSAEEKEAESRTR